MKYIPGTAKPTVVGLRNGKENNYEICVTCDANDGDYMYNSWLTPTLTEVDCLLIDYLRKHDGVWKKKSPYGRHYGHHIQEIPLGNWLCEEGWLIYAGACDAWCHSIDDIDVVYHDSQRYTHEVQFPNVENLFDSEEEFLNYIYDLIDYKEEDYD